MVVTRVTTLTFFSFFFRYSFTKVHVTEANFKCICSNNDIIIIVIIVVIIIIIIRVIIVVKTAIIFV